MNLYVGSVHMVYFEQIEQVEELIAGIRENVSRLPSKVLCLQVNAKCYNFGIK